MRAKVGRGWKAEAASTLQLHIITSSEYVIDPCKVAATSGTTSLLHIDTLVTIVALLITVKKAETSKSWRTLRWTVEESKSEPIRACGVPRRGYG